VLIASPGYAALRARELQTRGATAYPAADFLLPTNRFFDPNGDQIELRSAGPPPAGAAGEAPLPDAIVFRAFPRDGITSVRIPDLPRDAVADVEPESLFPRAVLSPRNSAGETFLDRDGDGRGDATDNCPNTPNSDQADAGGVATPASPHCNVPDFIGTLASAGT